jgi:hypothetical protein
MTTDTVIERYAGIFLAKTVLGERARARVSTTSIVTARSLGKQDAAILKQRSGLFEIVRVGDPLETIRSQLSTHPNRAFAIIPVNSTQKECRYRAKAQEE